MDPEQTSFAPPVVPMRAKGQDTLGAFELPLGGAVLVSHLLSALLPKARGLTTTALYAALALALWCGHSLERRWLHEPGRRHFRGTLYLRITWVVLGWSLLWASLPVAFAHARTWHWLGGWRDGPILLTLTLGLFHLTQGARLGVSRWVCLGGVLCLLAALLPGIRALREHMNLATALLAGGALILSGYAGQSALQKQGRSPRTPA